MRMRSPLWNNVLSFWCTHRAPLGSARSTVTASPARFRRHYAADSSGGIRQRLSGRRTIRSNDRQIGGQLIQVLTEAVWVCQNQSALVISNKMAANEATAIGVTCRLVSTWAEAGSLPKGCPQYIHDGEGGSPSAPQFGQSTRITSREPLASSELSVAPPAVPFSSRQCKLTQPKAVG